MSAPEFHVVGLGNAIVDVLAHAEDTFLVANGIEKGAMTLVDEARATELYDALGQTVQVSGGSAANTIAGVGSLGGKAAFIGKVRNDQLGTAFTHDIRSLGVAFDTSAADRGPATGRCLIVVSPDAERSMSTYLGAAQDLTPDDVDVEVISRSAITYLEGYLWDPPAAKEAFLKAAKAAHDAERQVALTLSDSFCVDRYRDEFRDLVKGNVDILFANEAEIMSLYQVDTFDEALQAVRGEARVAALTRSAAGSVIVVDGEVHVVDADKPSALVDTTGAGDQFAAGFMFGWSTGRSPVECGRMGSICASEVISHMGPRPEVALAELVASKGL
ncbi:adenosine kinase [Pyruvatibacter sp. HU-CL02332]|uniref:adenosine kinase n=1 Tax=Pyruvatibacter sp. HU-CL02332 TaxID=3127650 RepID=UPI003103C5A7